MSTTTAPMGIGSLGSEIRFIRKFRWTLSAEFPSGNLQETFVKLASRPEVPVLCPLTGILHWKGPNTVMTTFYDYDTEKLKPLWDICIGVYKAGENMEVNSPEYEAAIKNMIGTLTLKMYDGCGTKLDEYVLKDAWPTSINFGDLDHSSCDETMIEITWKYRSCEYTQQGLPPWNTETVKPVTDEGIKYPEIYGFKTPEKHKFVFTDGEPPTEQASV